MTGTAPLPRVLVYSSGNPAATFVTAGLLHGQPAAFGATIIRGTGKAAPTADVARILAEIGIASGGWVPPVADEEPAGPFAIGLTICVPT